MKPVDRPKPNNDPLYQKTLMIPELYLTHIQVPWDSTVFGMYNNDVYLYIKHENLFKIAHDS